MKTVLLTLGILIALGIAVAALYGLIIFCHWLSDGDVWGGFLAIGLIALGPSYLIASGIRPYV